MRFFSSVTFNNTQRKVFLVAGLVFLAAGALLVARWGGSVTTAAVLCGLGPCTASTANTSLSAAQGTVEFNTPATLTWHTTNVENSVPGVTCFGKNEVSSCGTPYQILAPGSTNAKKASYFTIGDQPYLAFTIEGDSAALFKWMDTVPDSASSNLPVDPAAPDTIWNSVTSYTQFDRSFKLATGKTIVRMATYVTTRPPNQYVGLKIAKRSTATNSWTVVYTQGCTATQNDVWLDCALSTPFTVPNDPGYDYYAGTYVNSNGGPLGQTPGLVPTAYRSGDQTPADGTRSYTENSTQSSNVVRAIYSTGSSSAFPCYGNGYYCDAPLQIFDKNSTRFGSGGFEPFAIGSDFFLAMGADTDPSRVFKWMPGAGNGMGCFGDGTTCGFSYQFLPGSMTSNGKGGFEAFKDGTNTYLALGNEGLTSKIYQWVSTISSASSLEKTNLGYADTTAFDRSWALASGKTVTHMGAYSEVPQTVTMKIAQRTAANAYTIVLSQSFSHPGGGWADFALPSPYTVPATGSYHVGVYAINDIGYNSYNTNPRGYKGGDLTGSVTGVSEDNTNAPSVRVRYSTSVGSNCLGDGVYCGLVVQEVRAGADKAKGGFESFLSGTTLYLAMGSNGSNSRLYQWMPAVFSRTSYPTPNNSGYSGSTAFDRSWPLQNGNTVTYMGAYSSVAQTVTVKIAQRTAESSYTIVRSQSFSHPGGGWADVALTSPYTVPASGEFYAGVYAAGQVGYNTNYKRANKSGDLTGSVTVVNEDNGNAPSVRVRYQNAVGTRCIGDGTYCDFPLQDMTHSAADQASKGGWKAFKMGSDTYLALASETDSSTLFKFMTAVPPFEPSNTGLTTGGSNLLTLDKSWRVDNSAKVLSISVWSPTSQTAYVKLAKKVGANSFDVVVSQACVLQPYIWTECALAGGGYTTDATSEYYAGVYAPNAVARKTYTVPRAARTGNSGTGVQTISEGTENVSEVRVKYEGSPASVTPPCLGNGYTCGEVLQEFPSTNNSAFGWDAEKLGSDYYLANGSNGDPSKIYRWMPIAQCFGDGTACGTAVQSLDAGAVLAFMPLSGKAYLASGGNGVDTKVYKGTEISSVYIVVNPSLTASTTRVYWSAANVANCSVTGPGLSWGPYATTSVATTSKMTTTAPVDGDVYTINCTTASGSISDTATAFVRSNFWDANGVYHDGVWPMEASNCATDGNNYTDCFKGNTFVSSKYGATAIFGAHQQGIGVGTILGYFGGHGPLASQGGGFEYTKTWSGPQFPNPPVNTKPEYYEAVVVPAGGKVELEWMCMNDQSQNVNNGCTEYLFGQECGDFHDPYHAYYSDSTVSSSSLSAANNWTGGALYGKRVVTVNQDVTYNLQCVGHNFNNPVTYPVTSIDVYVEGSPNIPPAPWQEPANTSGCTVYSYDSVNGTTTIAYGNDSPVGGFLTNNLVRNTTFTLSCTIEGGTTEESSIRVLIPPVVSVTSLANAAEPSTPGAFSIYLEDALDYPLTVNYTLGGTAVNGTDYQTIPLTATIYPGQQSTSTVIIPIDDLSFEGTETVELTLAAGTGYRVVAPVSATTTITDQENAQSLPTGPFVACGGTASSTCELAVNPPQVRLGAQTRVSWYVDGLIKGENGNPGDTCKIEASPTGSWSLPTFSIGAGNIWSGGASTTINARTTFTLTCTAPDGTTSMGVSKTVNIIPSFDEI